MPWTKKQLRTAQAVEHGWTPKGSAKGFTEKFAKQVVEEGDGKEAGRKKKAESMLGKGAHAAPRKR